MADNIAEFQQPAQEPKNDTPQSKEQIITPEKRGLITEAMEVFNGLSQNAIHIRRANVEFMSGADKIVWKLTRIPGDGRPDEIGIRDVRVLAENLNSEIRPRLRELHDQAYLIGGDMQAYGSQIHNLLEAAMKEPDPNKAYAMAVGANQAFRQLTFQIEQQTLDQANDRNSLKKPIDDNRVQALALATAVENHLSRRLDAYSTIGQYTEGSVELADLMKDALAHLSGDERKVLDENPDLRERFESCVKRLVAMRAPTSQEPAKETSPS